MTAPELKPCPFCGGESEKVELTDGENEGGSVIECTGCLACSHVEFGMKENLIFAWNRRADLCDPMQDPRVVALVEGHRQIIREFSGIAHGHRACVISNAALAALETRTETDAPHG